MSYNRAQTLANPIVASAETIASFIYRAKENITVSFARWEITFAKYEITSADVSRVAFFFKITIYYYFTKHSEK